MSLVITLTRIAPESNMARFYAMTISLSLFGDWILLRNWGRIGTRGRRSLETFLNAEAAEAALRAHLKHKQRRGYLAPRVPETSV